MVKGNNKVQKMEEEEKMVMGNIMTLLQQLMGSGDSSGMESDVSMAAGGPQVGDDEEMMAMKAAMVDNGMDEDMAMKAATAMKGMGYVKKEMEGDTMNDIAKSSEGPTANPEDKAEDRVLDGTEITEDNYSEVGKSLLTALSNMAVQKSSSVNTHDAGNAQVLGQITKVLKSISDRQAQTDQALGNILDAVGITDSVAKSATTQSAPVAPVGNLDGQAVIGLLSEVMKSQNKEDKVSAWSSVQKSANSNREGLKSLGQLFNR